jgi:type VI secretion system protein VasD
MNKTCLKSAVLASAVALFGGCAHPPPSPCTTPEPIRISLVASTLLNPGENGQSLPTTLRIYQLKDTGKLIESSLDRMLDGDRAVLGEDFVSVQELTLYPGDKVAPATIRSEGATNLAVVAFFRRPNGASWRAIRKLPPPDPQHCHGTVATPAALAASQLRFVLEDSRVEMK